MAAISHKERNFRRFIEKRFGIVLPEGVVLFYDNGVRCAERDAAGSDIRGDRGYAACDAGFNPTNSFIQNFGHLATRGFVEVDGPRAREFALGRGLGLAGGGIGGPLPTDGFVIVRSAGFTIGLGRYDSDTKKIRNLVPEKRRRNIINALEKKNKELE